MSVFPKDKLTSHAQVLKAHDRFLDGEEIGCTAEISGDNIYLREHHDYPDESQKWIGANFSKLVENALSNASTGL